MRSSRLCLLFVLTACLLVFASSQQRYKPVVMMHGILSSKIAFFEMRKWIRSYHPDTEVYLVEMYDYLQSLYYPMWTQARTLKEVIESYGLGNGTSYHLVAHSQGGLIARAMMQIWPEHSVDSFITLSSPLAGQYGDTDYLEFLFPEIIAPQLYRVLYSERGQKTFSIAGYWKDPKQIEMYLNNSVFLPVINNEVIHEESEAFKANFLKVGRVVNLGGPADGVITPWQSALWEFFDSNYEVVPLEASEAYKTDAFGLRTLRETKRLFMYAIDYVDHHGWHKNASVFHDYIEPYLT